MPYDSTGRIVLLHMQPQRRSLPAGMRVCLTFLAISFPVQPYSMNVLGWVGGPIVSAPAGM